MKLNTLMCSMCSKGVDNTQADSLSRIPLPRSVHSSKSVKKDEHLYLNYVISAAPTIDCKEIEKCTNRDRILSKVKGTLFRDSQVKHQSR